MAETKRGARLQDPSKIASMLQEILALDLPELTEAETRLLDLVSLRSVNGKDLRPNTQASFVKLWKRLVKKEKP